MTFHKRYSNFHPALSWILPSGEASKCSWGHSRTCEQVQWWRSEAFSQHEVNLLTRWEATLGADPPAAWSLMGKSAPEPFKMLQNSSPQKLWDVYCSLNPLSFGVICYIEIDNTGIMQIICQLPEIGRVICYFCRSSVPGLYHNYLESVILFRYRHINIYFYTFWIPISVLKIL